MTSGLRNSEDWTSLREKIFAAPWHLWAHAYGSASDVPPLLEAIVVGTTEEREDAEYQLYGNVFHQGTRWHASPRSVPFLLEMLALPIPDRAWLIVYLVHLALGYDEAFLPLGIDPEEEFRDMDEHDQEAQSPYDEDELQGAEYACYGIFARDSYRAVEAGAPLFLSLLDDSDLEIRLAAVYALAWFPSCVTDLARALHERWDTLEAGERANSLVALAVQGRWLSAQNLEEWRGRAIAALKSEDVGERFGGALALANWSETAGASWPEGALRVLSEVVVGDELQTWQKSRGDHALNWHSGDLNSLAAARLASAPREGQAQAMASLRAALRGAYPLTSLSLTASLLNLAFPRDEDGERGAIDPTNLNPEQRAALEAIVEHGAWRLSQNDFGNYSNLVSCYGLPDSQDKMRAWLFHA